LAVYVPSAQQLHGKVTAGLEKRTGSSVEEVEEEIEDRTFA